MLDPEDEDTIEMELTPSQVACLEEAAEQAEREAAAGGQLPQRALVEARARPRLLQPPAPVVPPTVSPAAILPAKVVSAKVIPAAVVPAKPATVIPTTIATLATTVVVRLPVVIPQVVLSPLPAPKGRQFLLTAGAVIVAVVAVATAYELGALRSPASLSPVPAVTPPVLVHPPASEAKLPAGPLLPPPQAIPVRFRNPFDTSEVFEFPPGTSETEARDAVADLLLKRAQQRQMQRANDPSLARRS